MKLKIAVLAGDGIGPEVTNEATKILRAVADFGGHEFTFAPALIGGVAITEAGSPLPKATMDLALDSDAVLLGAVGDNKFAALSPDKRPEAGLLQIRQALGGFANLRPLATAAGGNGRRRYPVRARTSGRALLRRAALVGPPTRGSHQHDAVHTQRGGARGAGRV
jgi:isocitrate/isopropylmalate dehydrogenase